MTRITPGELKFWREDQGLTQEDLAELMPVKIGTLQAWEQGKRNPPAYLGRALRDLERELSIRRALDKTRPV